MITDVQCRHTLRDDIEGFEVCRDCGTVLCQVTRSIEWIPGVLDTRQRASIISDEDWHDNGTCVGDKSLQRFHLGLSNGNKKRVYSDGREFIKNVCTDLNIGDAVESEALSIFCHLREQHGRWRGTRRIGVMIACVSLACQKLSVGISDATILNLQRVQQPSKTMNTQKKQVLVVLHKKGYIIDQAQASECCYRICGELGLNNHLSRIVSMYASKVSKLEHLNARSCNMIVAVSLLFFLEKNNLSMRMEQLCKRVCVTRPTLIKWYAHASQRNISMARGVIQSLDT